MEVRSISSARKSRYNIWSLRCLSCWHWNRSANRTPILLQTKIGSVPILQTLRNFLRKQQPLQADLVNLGRKSLIFITSGNWGRLIKNIDRPFSSTAATSMSNIYFASSSANFPYGAKITKRHMMQYAPITMYLRLPELSTPMLIQSPRLLVYAVVTSRWPQTLGCGFRTVALSRLHLAIFYEFCAV